MGQNEALTKPKYSLGYSIDWGDMIHGEFHLFGKKNLTVSAEPVTLIVSATERVSTCACELVLHRRRGKLMVPIPLNVTLSLWDKYDKCGPA